mmetsp:Transcript_1102/g.1979  ORF Transcript_1102/g.1979 Transcript_1102/m.1979 type:complete len:92 (+) Transcript_1102:1401-1676(+)
MFENGTTKSDDRMPTQKYQAAGGPNEKNGKDAYCSQAALRYNAYYKYVSEARGKLDRNALETELLKKWNIWNMVMMRQKKEEEKDKTKKSW